MNRYEIILSKSVRKFLSKTEKHIALSFFQKAQDIAQNPFDTTWDVKKLRWLEWKYRLRIGKYRFIYSIKEEKMHILFVEADSRWDIY